MKYARVLIYKKLITKNKMEILWIIAIQDYGSQIINVKFFLFISFLIIIFLSCYITDLYFLNSNIKNTSFFNIYYLNDINLLFKCQKDIKNQDIYKINCNHLKIVESTTYRHRGPDYTEYAVQLYSIDRTNKNYNILETVYISKSDCEYVKQFQSTSSRSNFTVTIYKNTKLIHSINY